MKILIVDDEQLARARLRSLLDELSHEVVAEAANGYEALQKVEQYTPDVVLMDIRMPGMDGLQAATKLMHLEFAPAIIFTTAYDEYALDAFKSQAVNYLLKPIRIRDLDAALKATTRLTQAQQQSIKQLQSGNELDICISAKVQGDTRLIPVKDIYYFQADQKYVTVGHRHGEVLIEDSLISLEQQYDQFIRIHRNALVAMKQIEALEKDSEGRSHIRLRDCDKKLEVSRRHLPVVRRWLKERVS